MYNFNLLFLTLINFMFKEKFTKKIKVLEVIVNLDI